MRELGMGAAIGKAGRVIARAAASAAVAALLATGTAATAQFSDSFNFLKAVRDRDGTKVAEVVERPGSQLINTRDYNTGEAALHILVKRRDTAWLGYLIGKGATVDIRDREGNTPLLLAAQLGYLEGVRVLIGQGAAVDAINNRGESALILAVQNRDAALVRTLITQGADARRPDRIAGKSARDYAAEDPRAAPLLKIIEAAPASKPKAPVAGPVMR